MKAVVLALLKSGDGASRKGSGHPLRKRLHAWWEGYELPPVPANGEPAAPADARAGASGAGGGRDSAWPEDRLKVAQLLWGTGFSKPGDADYVLALVEPLGLTGDNTLLEIGAGLGGGARAVAESTGAAVAAFDLSAELVARANEISRIKKLHDKAVVETLEPGAFEPEAESFDAGLLRETLMAIEDKDAVLQGVIGALKPDATIVVSDFFTPDAEPGPAVQEVIDGGDAPAFPCSLDEFVGKLEAGGIEIRGNDDETDRHAELVRAAWHAVAERIARNPLDEDVSQILMAEMEHWTRRNAAYEAGELRLHRIVGVKKADAG